MKNLILLILIFGTSIIVAQSKIKNIHDLINEKEENINVGLWALIIAKEFDNTVDIPEYLNKLDEMATEIKRMLAGRERDMDKFLAVKMFLYEPGEWNNYSPFSYDLKDPLGNILEHQLLSNYIDSRKGNCVSMPTLFLALLERVDRSIPFVGVKAPLHLFCRLRDRQTNDVWNIETTNGGNPARNQWYIDKMKIGQTALDNKIYLKDLTKKEYIAELIGTLIAKERRKGNFEKAMEYADMVIKLSPNSDLGLVNKGALYAEIGFKESKEKELSLEEKEYYNNESKKYIEKAESLGWKPESKEERAEYLKTVKEESKQKN